MTEVLKAWLRNRLGVTVDPNPDNFGEYARDGTLLARVLHSYDVVNSEQLKIIKKTDDPVLARVNLKHLKVWLRFFNVDISDECIDDVSNGRGVMAAHLFHQIYLYLADKDRLYFITEQRLRENRISDSVKFDVTVISEIPKSSQVCDESPAKSSIDDAASNRGKFQNIVDRCKKARDKCVEIQDQKTRCALLEKSRNLDGEFCKRRNECSSGFADEESRRYNEELKTGVIGKKYPDVCDEKSCDAVDVRRAEETRGTRNRTKKLAEAFKLKGGMEKALMSEAWDKMLRAQEKEFDEIIAKKLLCQSHFEKQMMTKLCEILGQKKRIIGNREIVERLMQEQQIREKTMKLARAGEKFARKKKHIDFEYQRLFELRSRISADRLSKSHVRHAALCSDVLNDLVDMSVKAGEYRYQNGGCVPKQLRNEWRTLFLKCQPIFEQIETPGTEIREGTCQSMRLDERLQCLSSADFDSYLNLTSPWNERLHDLDSENTENSGSGIVVLGHIVHRLLRHIYPLPLHPKSAPVPKVSTACILLGVLDSSLYPIIQELLKPREIRLVRIEDAINYCLLCYENEMRDYGYMETTAPLQKETIKAAKGTEENKRREQTEKKRRNSKTVEKQQKKTRSESKVGDKSREQAEAKDLVDRETQTPRLIPPCEDADEVLSQPANFGKWARMFLNVGQPISDDLCTNILIEYLKSLGDARGWVLIDYPNTYNQMAKLESMLTGHEIPSREANAADSDASSEEVPRIVYRKKVADELATFRESRLIPDPLPRKSATPSKTFMTAYIRAIPMREDLRISMTDVCEILPEDSVDTDAFYVERGIAHALYYVTFDALTLEKMCRCIIGDKSVLRELFGEGLGFRETKLEKTSVVEELIPAGKNNDWDEEANGLSRGEGGASSRELFAAEESSESGEIKPGEKDWNWIDFPLAPELMESLARRWEIAENTYLRDLREIFLEKRMHLSSITAYQNRITNQMNEFVQGPDEKQDMLRNFQVNFNNVGANIRKDGDTRTVLRNQLDEFRRELWEICYEKRKRAENERRRVICENWVSENMLALANLFISMQQTELDRCIDTIELLRDYYVSMLRKPVAQARLTRYVLQRMQFGDESTERNARSEKTGQCGPRIDCDGVEEQVANLLIDNDAESFEASELISYKALRTSLSFVRTIVDSVASSALENIKKHETAGKRKMRSSKKFTARSKISKDDDLQNDFGKRASDFCREWRSALFFEINRMRMRLKLIDNVALSELAFSFHSINNTFHRVLGEINDRYKKEMESIDDMDAVFCSAIEEGISVPEKLIFDGNKFVVRSNAEESVPRLVEGVVLPSKFRMGQLGCLMEIFRRVAPIGSLSERSFVYILEDLLDCGEEEGRKSLLPDSWAELSSRGISAIVEEIFGDADHVDWREFIVYATDIPMPSTEQILDAKSQFMALDPDAKEMINRDEYRSISLWFSNCSVDDPACQNLLGEDLERGEDETEENEEVDSHSANKRKSNCSYLLDSQCMQDLSRKTNTAMVTSWNPRENLRLMLAKELLFELFLIEDDSINYAKFLLAFCKGPVPKVGLGKALGLALGGRVCIDDEEGERSWERRRLIADAEDTANEIHGTVEKVLKTTTKDLPGRRLDDTNIISAARASRDSLRQFSRHSRHDRSIGAQNVDEASIARPSSKFGIAEIGTESNRRESLSGSLADGRNGRESFSMLAKVKTFYWIPREVLETVLLTALPQLTASDLHLRLNQVCEEISDASLGIEEGYVLSHQIVNHEVVQKILDKTSRFTVKHIGNIVGNILNADRSK